ncbi:MAG TPA: lamin tail domain-containing protein [Pyrinomonadaceae bacterium]|nr:lamin tail domain-containing protein [Pyrinomonadaceae bacterium]
MTLFPNLSPSVRLFLRRAGFAVVCLAMLTQTVFLNGAISVVAQEKAKATNSKKRTKKTKRSRATDQMVLPAIIPSLAQPPVVVDQPRISPSTPVPAKRSVSTSSTQAAPQNAPVELQSRVVEPVATTVVNMRALASQKTSKRLRITLAPKTGLETMPVPGSIGEVDTPSSPAEPATSQITTDEGGLKIASPSPAQNFQGAVDEAVGGGTSGTFTIPPDTTGAVGLDKVVTMLNNNMVIHDKATGAQLSLVSMTSFWTAAGGSGHFDPRIQYDPYNNRWIVAAVSNAQTANSSVLVGISDSPNPQGSYTLFRFIVGCAPGSPGCNAAGGWADFPMLGFNKNWVVVTWNNFTINTLAFTDGRALVLDYPSLREGEATATIFSGASAAIGGFCMHPATTFSPTEETMYVPTHIGSAAATYRLHRITGTPAAPTFTVDPANRTRPGGGWTQPGGDVLPQQCVPGVGAPTQTCPATIRQFDVGDAFVRSNVVFRNGKIYYPQTIALPAGGITNNSRFAAQWTVLNNDGTFFDGGRLEDATATRINGGKHYGYPSLSVNKNNDMILGFTEFESDDYADAGYAIRLGSDAAGTLRDPLIYKEGEDYYQKTFSGSRNRWGDYSHSMVDPVNDTDLWTLQEYARLRVGTTGLGTNDSRWGTWWAKVNAPAGAGGLLISEFRLRGPSGANDEFVEIYNPSSTAHTVTSSDGSAGYSVAASDGVVRFVIPNGTVIPAKGHYLGVNSVAYSLSSYPAGNGTTANGDATYTTDIPDNAGIALFSTANTADFALGVRIDAVGSTAEANTLYKEGTGYTALTPFSIDYSFYRSYCPGNTPVFGSAIGCGIGSGGLPKDSDNNAADFVFVDTNGTSAGAGQRLGAPAPENLSSPIDRNAQTSVLFVDASTSASLPPNRVRDLTSDPANNSTFGTIDIRRRVVNNTGGPVTRLRFRIIDVNSFPAPSGFADLRSRTSTSVVVSGVNDEETCSPNPAPCSITIFGTTLEQPPSQPNGGGFNSTQSAGIVSLDTPLPNGASINVRFLLGIQQTGSFRFFLNVEALP